MTGLKYAFPNRMAVVLRRFSALEAHRERVAKLPSIADYLESPRRQVCCFVSCVVFTFFCFFQPFTKDGIFRHYPELDIE
jgi:glutathione S-transferase